MKEKVENLGWFSRMEELVEALEDLGLEVLEANREYVVVGYEEDEEDVQLILHIGGTENTIIIASVDVERI
ncbi:hypothetical protein [Flavonifractor plautii]|jgi:hypothetical protein|uniref:Uncharacterized protein n=1 Tax=Flavonifractor plautii TaxID=292800 RepID=A0A6I2QXN1_FLAPL|nr:hypothetical protein [Flavonifractor plautii]MSB19098.1 hypothetical protein [Flavonifractor plautii]MSB83202.1 hypothetical protein [Flavonifractor plautii]DAK79598.1 MAG TPA: hypothetical protein [Caudoviricetes sp.]